MKNVTIFKGIVLTTIVLILSSCSNSNWDCPAAKRGEPCQTIASSDKSNNTNTNASDSSESITNKNNKADKHLLQNPVKAVQPEDVNPSRTQEKIGRILITPYIDKEGNLNSSKYIYTIDEKPEWRMQTTNN